jgi:hypothetical protein
MPRFAFGLPHLCRDCGNRTKPVRHGVGWCLIDDQPVPQGMPTDCAGYTPRHGATLPDPPDHLSGNEPTNGGLKNQ